MKKLEGQSEIKKIVEVNKFFNRVRYQTDIKNWGEKDYWATRMEFLGRDKGDCEDYVIAKYFTLKQLGVDTKKLYLTYVKLVKYKQAHMVLTYFKKPRSIPLVLDNFNKKILPATKRRDLKPVYSFNGDSLFLAKQVGLGKSVPSAFKKNKKWLKLIDDVKRNKI
jgi:predicted transglutaminase-like cysteine proteinase